MNLFGHLSKTKASLQSAIDDKGFSFDPGDDFEQLLIARERAKTAIFALDVYANSQASRNSNESLDMEVIQKIHGEQGRQPKLTAPKEQKIGKTK